MRKHSETVVAMVKRDLRHLAHQTQQAIGKNWQFAVCMALLTSVITIGLFMVVSWIGDQDWTQGGEIQQLSSAPLIAMASLSVLMIVVFLSRYDWPKVVAVSIMAAAAINFAILPALFGDEQAYSAEYIKMVHGFAGLMLLMMLTGLSAPPLPHRSGPGYGGARAARFENPVGVSVAMAAVAGRSFADRGCDQDSTPRSRMAYELVKARREIEDLKARIEELTIK